MVNIHYGFETLAHRYYVLTGKNAPSIDVDNRFNLAGILEGVYGEHYVSTPHMQKLMIANGGTRRDFVLGKDEVELFKQGEYARLHASTTCKVRLFSDFLDLTLDRKLRTERARIYVKIERATDGLIAKLIGLAASVYAIIDIARRVFNMIVLAAAGSAATIDQSNTRLQSPLPRPSPESHSTQLHGTRHDQPVTINTQAGPRRPR